MLETIKITCEDINSTSFKTNNGFDVLEVNGFGMTLDGPNVPTWDVFKSNASDASLWVLSHNLQYEIEGNLIYVTGETFCYAYKEESLFVRIKRGLNRKIKNVIGLYRSFINHE